MPLNQVFFYQDAWSELLEAVNDYNAKAKGLGRQFLKAIERGIEQINTNPQSFPVHQETQTRMYSLQRLPYLIYFITLDQEIWIVGVEKTFGAKASKI
ncbi:MAG: type II toxin-antitoxin system RelE/ParE family toxin [Candidatus Magnetomorum sp.]|nr:type II toxin-antitoxin system RelE/ParE family toxin [Candidatus Magnetomorum sp.]